MYLYNYKFSSTACPDITEQLMLNNMKLYKKIDLTELKAHGLKFYTVISSRGVFSGSIFPPKLFTVQYFIKHAGRKRIRLFY